MNSDKFSLYIALYTGLEGGIGSSADQNQYIRSSYTISAFSNDNSRQTVFSLPIEDYNDEPIIPDTTRIRYHEEVVLNNSTYTGIYSNENLIPGVNATGLNRKEKIYFDPQKGLVAVRDSLGILWTKVL